LSSTGYGVDIGYEYDGNEADGMNTMSDIATVSEIDNLYQAIQNRLLTPVGSLPLHPTYGSRLHTLLGMGNNIIIETLAKMMVVEALQPESRIALIRNIDVYFSRDGNSLSIAVDIVSIYSSELSVKIELR